LKKDIDNPFADYGNIVRGERFIGRKNDLRVIENRIIRPKEPGNLAIIGEPRIGKSSLIYKAIIERKEELLSKRLLPIWLNLATFDQSAILFRTLVTRCYDDLEEFGWLSKSVKYAAERALQDELSWSEGYGRIQRFFEKVRQTDVRVLFVLDEFDHARHLFKGDISGFQGLRELSYRPEWRTTLITTSRRSIRDIELQTHAISTLDGIFHKHYLSMFTTQDMQEYFQRLSSVKITLPAELRERVDFYCGGHPYLLEMLGYEIVEMFRERFEVDIDQTAKRIEQSFLDVYDHMINILSEDESLSKMLQILFGPVVDVKPSDAEGFQRYGLIKFTDQGTYTAFSEHFHDYLRLVERQVDLWPVWRDTETSLRHIIVDKMIEKYGELWMDKLEKAHRNVKAIFDKCREAQQKEEQSFGGRASRSLIDFTYPLDLFTIIFAEWSIFEPIFKRDKNYWSQRAQLLAKVRNPLAHNRASVLDDYERQIAEGYCKEISKVLQAENV